MRKGIASLLACFILVACGVSVARCVFLRDSESIPMDEAVKILDGNITERQARVLTAAIRRQCSELIATLVQVAKRDDAAGMDARAALIQLQSDLR